MPMRRARTLVVEDDEAICEIVRATLSDRGSEVDTAPDGREGLEAIRNTPSFGLAILDFGLPGLSGSQLLRCLETESSGTEVIVMSGYATDQLKAESVAHGAFTVLEKPFRIADLVHLVDRLLQLRRGVA